MAEADIFESKPDIVEQLLGSRPWALVRSIDHDRVDEGRLFPIQANVLGPFDFNGFSKVVDSDLEADDCDEDGEAEHTETAATENCLADKAPIE